MAKLTKHSEVLNQLHAMVVKQAAEAQKNISGAPGEDVTAESINSEHETTNKNSVGPENNPQGYSQKPSEDKSEPLTSAKTAETIGAEILDIIKKEAEAQKGITGKPGADVTAESIDGKHESFDKNKVKPEDNKPQEHKQKASKDSSEPLTSAKKAEVEELAAKVASYELGRQFCAAILKTAGDISAPSEAELMKEAGRRDFDLLIAEAAEDLENPEVEKTAEDAEAAGAAYFDEVLKEAALGEAVAENAALQQKLAEFQNYYASEQTKVAQWNASVAAQQQQVKLAETVADIVLGKLKTEITNAPVA